MLPAAVCTFLALEGAAMPLAQKPPATPPKAAGSGFIQSLLLPGFGQIAQGRKTVGYAFMTAEATLLAGVLGLRLYASWLEDDYRQFARQHAGVSADRDHQYYVDIGNWMNEREYNHRRLQDREFDRMYLAEGDRWQWDSDGSRLEFKGVRLRSDLARNQAVLFVGGLILNHLFSAIDAGRGDAKTRTMSASVGTLRGNAAVRIGMKW